MPNILVPDSELPRAGVLEASAPAVDGPSTPAAVAAGVSSEPIQEVPAAPVADIDLPALTPDYAADVAAPSGGPTVEAAAELPPEPEEWNYFDDQANIRRMAAEALDRGDSERAARVAALADHYNASQVQVEMNLEQQEKRFRKDRAEAMLAELPVSAKYFTDHPLDAPIFKDDLQPLALLEKQFGKLGSVQGWSPAIDPHTPATGTFSREEPLILGDDESTGDPELDERIQMVKRPGDYLADVAGSLGDWYKVGTLQTEQGLMWNRARQGFDAVDDRLLAEDKRIESEMTELTGDAEGNAIYEAAVVVGQMVSSLMSASAVEGAAKGAAVGGASASVVPGIGTAAGIMGGAFLGAAAQSTLDVEAGSSYRSMYQAGVSPTAARWLSTGVGAVNSLIEMAGIKVLGEAARPLMRTLTASFGAKTVNAALATPTMGAVLKNAAIAYAGGMGEEVATEVMQEGVNMASEEIARLYAGGNFDAVNGEVIFDRLSEIAWKTLQATAVLGVVGGGAAMGVGARRVNRAHQTKEFFETVAKAVPEMKSAQIAPTKVHQLIAAQAEQAGAETTYIDGSEFRQAMVDEGVSLSDLRQVAPEVADQVEAAAELGVDVEIPTASYATQLASTPLGARLQDHVRLAQDALSVADLLKVDRARKELMRQIVKSTFSLDEQNAADRFVDSVESKQWREESARIQNEIATSIRAAAPQFDESEVQTQARLGAMMLTRLAQNAGFTPERMATIAPKIRALQAPAATEAVGPAASSGLSQQAASTQAPRGSFNPSSNTITLTPNSDLSTFAHEMSHWYLANLIEFSKLEGVDPSLKEDVATLLTEFGLKDVAEWDALGVEGQRKFHERFAYQAEIYLSTGQAPTRGLERFFARFATWIRSVYSHWAGGAREALGAAYQKEFGEALPDINPGVKRVFDRMLVAQRDLDFAESANGLKALFDEKPSDMPEDQWRELMSARDESVAEGEARLFEAQAKDEKWYVNARLRQSRRLDREAKAYRARVREKVKARIDGRKEFVAFDALKSGGRALGIENLKIDPKSLEAMGLKPAVIKKLQDLGLTKKGGFPITATRQLLSPLARFKTNEQLVAGLIAGSQDRTKLIEDETSRICLENKSDYFDPKKKEELIQKAIHNEARGRMVATELKYLSGDKTMSARIIREAARQVALERFGRMQAGKVSPKVFMAAESRASREAYTLLTKGDRLGAAMAKRKQLLNHELALMAIDFKRTMDKFDDLRKQIFKADKELAKSRDVDIVAVARYILNASGLGRIRPRDMSADALEKTIAKFKNNSEEKFREYQAQLAPYAYSPGRNYDWKTYSTADIRSIFGQVSDLWKKAGDERRVILNGQKHDLDEIVDQLVEVVETKPVFSIGANKAVTSSEKFDLNFLGFKASMTRVETWCRKMDGGQAGLFTKYIYQPVEDAVAKYKNENAAYQKRFADLVKPLESEWRKMDPIDAPEIGYTFTTKAELIGALLHTGNESNKRKLLLGGRGTDSATGKHRAWAYIEEVEGGAQRMNTDAWDSFINRMFSEGKITKADMDFCQGVWDLLEETKPKAQAAYMEMYGYRFEEVQASPVVTPFGTYRGGYVPAMTDPDIYAKSEQNMKQEELEQTNFMALMPVRKPGFSNTRVENFTRPLNLHISMIGSHITKVLRFADIAPAVMQVDKIVSSHRFQDALAAHDPKALSVMIKPFLTRAVSQTVSDGRVSKWDSLFNGLRGLAGMNIMFMNFVNTFQQITGLSIAAVKVPPTMLGRNFLNYFREPKRSADFVMAASPFMKSRLENYAYEYQRQVDEVGDFAPKTLSQAEGIEEKAFVLWSKGTPVRNWVSRHGYILQTLAQYPIDVGVWSAAYEYNIGKGLSHEEAVHEADSVIRTTQSDFNPENVAAIESGSAAKRFFLVFYNYFNMQWNLLGEQWALRKAQKRYGRFVLDAALIVWIPSVVGKLISDALMGGGSDEDDPDDAFDTLDFIQLVLGEPLKSLISTIPFAGNVSSWAGAAFAQAGSPVAQAIWGKEPYLGRIGSAPALSFLEGSIKGAVDLLRVIDGDDTVNARTATRNIMDLGALVTGMPIGGLKRPVGYMAGVLSGDIEGPDTTLGAVRGLIAGK